MVRRSRVVLLVVSLVAALGLVTACVDSSQEEAETPAGAQTVANSAIQTNSEGEVVTAPAETPPTDTSGGEAPPTDTSGGEAPPAGGGDVAAGEAIVAGSCSSCHLNSGKDAGGIGPKLAAAGLDEATIRDVLINGRPGTAMAGGLVTGDDLENTVAYILSLQ